MRMMLTADLVQPSMICRSIGAAPRYHGSGDGCRLMEAMCGTSSNVSGRIRPYESRNRISMCAAVNCSASSCSEAVAPFRTGMEWRFAHCCTGFGTDLPRRTFGTSEMTARTTSYRAATASKTGTDKADDPKTAMRGTSGAIIKVAVLWLRWFVQALLRQETLPGLRWPMGRRCGRQTACPADDRIRAE